MSAHPVRCPACSAPVASRVANGRHWCTACDEVFEVHDLTDDAPVVRRRPGRARDDAPPRATNRALIVACVVCALFGSVGVVAAAYFALTRGEPKPVAVAPAPVVPPKPVAPEPKKDAPKPVEPKPPEPKKVEPKPPTYEETVRRVKGATVYVRTPQGTGSGFFAGPPGFVVTNAHVVGYAPPRVRPPTKVEVVVNSGEAGERVLAARVFGADVEADLAVLKVESGDLPAPLAFGKAAGLIETQEVVIYGYPFGELLGKNISVNRSTVSSLRREGGKLVLVQLAGGLNPGNSGGPVTNVAGEVVGVSVAKLRGTDTIAFAIPAEDAAAFVRDQERSGGRFELGGGAAAVPVPPRPPLPPPGPMPTNPQDVLPDKPTGGRRRRAVRAL